MPMVEVSGLTIVPSARIVYAATHGRGGWSMQLPYLGFVPGGAAKIYSARIFQAVD